MIQNEKLRRNRDIRVGVCTVTVNTGFACRLSVSPLTYIIKLIKKKT